MHKTMSTMDINVVGVNQSSWSEDLHYVISSEESEVKTHFGLEQ